MPAAVARPNSGRKMTVLVTSHDPSWKDSFSREARRLTRTLGDSVVAAHHIGSTAIPGIVAKPVIDVLVEVKHIDRVDENASQMSNLFYEAMGEYGIAGRRYFRRPKTEEDPAFHVHVFEVNAEQVVHHLAFRDYLLARPEKAREYSTLKIALSTGEAASKSEYQKAKAPFIEACLKDALRGTAIAAG